MVDVLTLKRKYRSEFKENRGGPGVTSVWGKQISRKLYWRLRLCIKAYNDLQMGTFGSLFVMNPTHPLKLVLLYYRGRKIRRLSNRMLKREFNFKGHLTQPQTRVVTSFY